jgi:hypothetical protein
MSSKLKLPINFIPTPNEKLLPLNFVLSDCPSDEILQLYGKKLLVSHSVSRSVRLSNVCSFLFPALPCYSCHSVGEDMQQLSFPFLSLSNGCYYEFIILCRISDSNSYSKEMVEQLSMTNGDEPHHQIKVHDDIKVGLSPLCLIYYLFILVNIIYYYSY